MLTSALQCRAASGKWEIPVMINYECPHCGAGLEAPGSLAGQDQVCPVCRQRTVVPLPTARVATSALPLPYVESPNPPGIITTPLLISAIWNCLAAIVWLSTCFGIVFTAPLVVLLIFEFMLYADLNNNARIVPPSKVKTIAICEIVAGLISLALLACGIIILTNLGHVNVNKGKVPC